MDSGSKRQAPDVMGVAGVLSTAIPQDSAKLAGVSSSAQSLDFRALFDANASYVSASLGRLGIAPSDREDLVVEVFVRVHRELARFDEARPLKPWLFAFAARVASEHRRLARHRREVLSSEDDDPAGTTATATAASAPDAQMQMESAEARQLVHRALETLDDDKRAVFVLHDLDETPVPEIARALGIPEGTAYSRLRAARAEFTATIRAMREAPSKREVS